MSSLTFGPATEKDLEGILRLQQTNLKQHITAEEAMEQGFLTVEHDMELLRRMNDHEPHIVARDGSRVVGYTLAMTRELRDEIPVLVPMFQLFNQVSYRGKPLAELDYLVVGQVCVDKAYRGQAVLDRCYAQYRQEYAGRYALAITDIASTNHRSLRVHERVGFQEIERFTDSSSTEWVVVVWDWR